jgi:hypothetical protein
MPASTDHVFFPNGCLARYSLDGTTFTDLGVLLGDSGATYNYDINLVTFSQGQKRRQYKNQTIAASLTLADLNPDAISALSGGMIRKTTTAGVAVTTAPDQVLSSGAWAKNTPIEFVIETSDSDSTKLKASEEPTISVEGSVDGAMAEGTDYEIVVLDSSFAGYGIVILDAATLAQDVTITFTSVTPLESTTLTAGESTYTPDTIALQFYEEVSGRTMTIYACNVDSGGYNFGFKGVDSDGVEEMALAFTGEIDTTRTAGDQLFSWVLTE